MRHLSILTLAIISLTVSAFADDATQTDWSGGDGVPGPVTDWADQFDSSTDINWLGTPGELRLSSMPITPVEHIVEYGFDGARSVYAADINGDGDMDIIGAAWDDNDIFWWENDGSGYNWAYRGVDYNFTDACSVYAADIDNDDDMDIIGASNYENKIVWWENVNGSGTSWTEHDNIVDFFLMARSVYVADIDDDGDNDILGAGGSEIAWFENKDGLGINWGIHTVDRYFNGAYSVYAEDINDDGDMDILGAAFNGDDIT